jgi:hypothetical protein
MLQQDELKSVYSLKDEYQILICNAHDVRLQSRVTGHEWIIISPYDGSACEILHRHSSRYAFHHQRGKYLSMQTALAYIKEHDNWFAKRDAVQ